MAALPLLSDPRSVVRLAGLPSNPPRTLAYALRATLHLRTTPLVLRGGEAEGLCFMHSGAERAAALAVGHVDILGVRVAISAVGGRSRVDVVPQKHGYEAMGSRVCAGPDCAARDRVAAKGGNGTRAPIVGVRYRKVCLGFFNDECEAGDATFGTRMR